MPLPLLAMAQQSVPAFRFAYLNYDKVFYAMADYATATRSYNDLKAEYDVEAKRFVEDFNSRYEDFLDVQRKLEPSTLRRRQAGLEELMGRNTTPRKESGRLLKKAEEDIYVPVHAKLNNAARQMGEESGYVFILNADNSSVPFVNITMREDATEALIAALK